MEWHRKALSVLREKLGAFPTTSRATRSLTVFSRGTPDGWESWRQLSRTSECFLRTEKHTFWFSALRTPSQGRNTQHHNYIWNAQLPSHHHNFFSLGVEQAAECDPGRHILQDHQQLQLHGKLTLPWQKTEQFPQIYKTKRKKLNLSDMLHFS